MTTDGAGRAPSACGVSRWGQQMGTTMDEAGRKAEEGADDAGHARVSLGFRDVTPSEKTQAVGDIFSRVAGRYDLMNDMMSGGLHRLWKNDFVRRVRPRAGEKILDLAGGTGDIAFRMARRGASVTVSDINPDMLEVGKKRARARGLDGLSFAVVNAEDMPFPDESFDAVTISFGIRNVTDIPAALAEARRVLKWGGRFHCMEFSRTEWPGFAQLYDRYSMEVVPKIGKYVARDEPAYQYLVESIRRFPPMGAFARMLAAAGFTNIGVVPVLGGVVAMHSGWKS